MASSWFPLGMTRLDEHKVDEEVAAWVPALRSNCIILRHPGSVQRSRPTVCDVHCWAVENRAGHTVLWPPVWDRDCSEGVTDANRTQ